MIPETYHEKLSHVSVQKRKMWEKQQLHIKNMIVQADELTCPIDNVKLVAGVDISFSGKYENGACAGLVIYEVGSRKIIYQDFEYVVLKEDYVPGFLAFRELGPTLELFNRLKLNKPNLWPQVILVDGNGILHKRHCGYASHLGVLLKTPCFGCAKTFFDVDGLHKSEVEDFLYQQLRYYGEHQIIKGKSGKSWCTAILIDQNQDQYLYVSIGTKISLSSATKLALKLLKYETPQPVRLVDRISRKQIRQMTEADYKKAKSYDIIYLSH